MDARKIIAVTACIFVLSACGAPPQKPTPAPQPVAPPKKLNLNDPQDVAGASSVQRDEYKKTNIYRGPNIAEKSPDQLFIRAWKADTGNVTYQIDIAISYSGVWRFYNHAYDVNGNALDLMLLTRNLSQCQSNDCSHNEHISIDVTQKHLQEYKNTGLRFWVSGKVGKEAFFIPAGYIKAFLSLSDTSH